MNVPGVVCLPVKMETDRATAPRREVDACGLSRVERFCSGLQDRLRSESQATGAS